MRSSSGEALSRLKFHARQATSQHSHCANPRYASISACFDRGDGRILDDRGRLSFDGLIGRHKRCSTFVRRVLNRPGPAVGPVW
jgi:hypothetical protein